MALPTPVDLTAIDAQGDDPRQMRDTLFQMGTKLNALIAALGNHVEADLDPNGGIIIENNRIKVKITPTSDVDIDFGEQT